MPESLCQNLIVLFIDNLHPAFLGCYGNSTVDTEHLDRLATESVVFDECYVSVPDCRSARASIACGNPAPALAGAPLPGLPWGQMNRRLAWFGPARLLDISAPAFSDFHEAFGIEVEEQGSQGPGDVLAAAVDWISKHHRDTPFVAWIELADLLPPRSVPIEWLNLYQEEIAGAGEADGRQSVTFEELESGGLLEAASDEEALESFRVIWGALLHSKQALEYASTLTWLDEAVGDFLGALRDSALWTNTAVVVASDHGESILRPTAGIADDPLLIHQELLHVPLMIRIPGGEKLVGRSRALCDLADLGPAILDLCGIADSPTTLGSVVRGESNTGRTELLHRSTDGRQWALRTPEWLFLTNLDPTQSADWSDPLEKEQQILENSWLFARPEDRWQRNDLKRSEPAFCVELYDRLVELAGQLRQAASGP